MTTSIQYISQLKKIDWQDHSSRNKKLREMKKEYGNYVQNVQQGHEKLLQRCFLITIAFFQYIFISLYIIITNHIPAFCIQQKTYKTHPELQQCLTTLFSNRNYLCNLLNTSSSLCNHGAYDISFMNRLKEYRNTLETLDKICSISDPNSAIQIKRALLELHANNNQFYKTLPFPKLDHSKLTEKKLKDLYAALSKINQEITSIKDSSNEEIQSQFYLFSMAYNKFLISYLMIC